jgi:hypothetical protein
MEHCSCLLVSKLSVTYYVLIYQGMLNLFLCVYIEGTIKQIYVLKILN